jgi:hypothetical protein
MRRLYGFVLKYQTLHFILSTLQMHAVFNYQSTLQTPLQTNPPDVGAREVAAYSRRVNLI